MNEMEKSKRRWRIFYWVTGFVIAGTVIIVFILDGLHNSFRIENGQVHVQNGFYGASLSLEEAVISYQEEGVVITGLIYGKNDGTLAKGYFRLEGSESAWYLALNDQTLAHIELVIGDNHYLINDADETTTAALYQQLLAAQNA